MSSKSVKRLTKELALLHKAPSPSVVNVELVNEDVMDWVVTLLGPQETPYAKGKFRSATFFSFFLILLIRSLAHTSSLTYLSTHCNVV